MGIRYQDCSQRISYPTRKRRQLVDMGSGKSKVLEQKNGCLAKLLKLVSIICRTLYASTALRCVVSVAIFFDFCQNVLKTELLPAEGRCRYPRIKMLLLHTKVCLHREYNLPSSSIDRGPGIGAVLTPAFPSDPSLPQPLPDSPPPFQSQALLTHILTEADRHRPCAASAAPAPHTAQARRPA